MSIAIKVPAMGESVTEATIARWLKREGEAVKQGAQIIPLRQFVGVAHQGEQRADDGLPVVVEDAFVAEREQGIEDGLTAEVLRVQIDQDVANQ